MGIKGLVTSHGNILGHLYLHGPTRMAEIAKQINRKKNTVTTLVYKLEQQGYVKITTDENDLRARIVSLTPKAEEIRDDFFAISIGLVEKTFMGIAEDEREQVLSCLTKMRDNLE